MEKDTLCINLFGGPGVGKSTTAAGVFSLLKLHGIDCELIDEFAKQMVWEERQFEFGDQHFIFGRQHHKMWILNGKVDVMVTDSPLLLSAVYRPETLGAYFVENVVKTFSSYTNINILLERVKPYNPNGRNETEEEAKIVDNTVKRILTDNNIAWSTIPGSFEGINTIAEEVLRNFNIDMRFKINM